MPEACSGRTGVVIRAVSDMFLHDLKKLDASSWFDHGFCNERLPSLSEVLDEARGRVLVNIEIKHSACRKAPEEGIEQL